MRIRSLAALTVAATLALPIHAQAPAQPTTTTPAPAVVTSTERAEEPSLEERRLVAYVSTGVAVVSLAAGITLGVLAKSQFDCAADILTCNAGLQNKVVGEELFDLRAEIEQKALFADMAFLFADASAVDDDTLLPAIGKTMVVRCEDRSWPRLAAVAITER